MFDFATRTMMSLALEVGHCCHCCYYRRYSLHRHRHFHHQWGGQEAEVYLSRAMVGC